MIQELLLLACGLLAGLGGAWFVLRRGKSQDQATDTVVALQRDMYTRLDHVAEQLDQRLRENARSMDASKSLLVNQVNNAERTVREVSTSLGRLEQATAALKRTNDEIASFQNLLKSPKVRGSFGEVLLLSLLADVLPADRYATQFQMKSTGEIADAIIRLQDGYIVSVDAKFPLANYQLLMTESDETRRILARRHFVRDIKKHISDISHKYISPEEKTLDYAFMYIPIEGVYYETMVHDPGGESLWEFCLQQKVIPVSPNSFLAYLHTILVGLRGMKIEQQAKEILQNLGQMRRDFGQFAEDFTMVGKHLNNAKNRFDASTRRLDKFANRLEQVELDSPVTTTVQLPEPATERVVDEAELPV